MARRSVAHLYSDYRWVLLSIVGATAAVLGWIGLRQYLVAPSVGDMVFNTFKLFVFSAPTGPGLPLPLDIARLLAPLVAGYATLAALARLFSDRVQQMRIPMMRDHVVVCGLGYSGSVFLRQLREADVRAVVIEVDPANPLIDLCRSLRIPVVVGDAQNERTLRAAGAQRASRLLAVCPNDAVNAEIIAVARRLVATRTRRELRCLARIADPELCALLRVQEANLPANTTSSLDYFNTDEVSARLWLDEFPIQAGHGEPHIVVNRLDAVGRWLVLHAAWSWHAERGDSAPLWISVIDAEAQARVQALIRQCPDLERVCRFRTSSPAAYDVRRMLDGVGKDGGGPTITRAYVSAYRDEDAIESALVLWQELRDDVPIVVALSRSYGVARLIEDGSVAGELRNIDVFRALERTCTIDLIQGGSYERIAEAIHRRWRGEQLAAGKPAPTWRELDESRQESNRDQARDIVAKLRSIGCSIAPLRDWGAAQFEFSSEEVERLAIAEHERWVAERTRSGWRPGSRDPANKTTPYLISFEQLPPDIADLDRSAVLGMPGALASAGLQINRG